MALLILLNAVVCMVIDPGSLTTAFHKQDFQRQIENKPELGLMRKNRNFCMMCQIPKIARSQHCIYCKK